MSYDDYNSTVYNLEVLPEDYRERVSTLIKEANRKDAEAVKLFKKSNTWAWLSVPFIALYVVGAIPFLIVSFYYKNQGKNLLNEIKVIETKIREIYIHNNLGHELNY